MRPIAVFAMFGFLLSCSPAGKDYYVAQDGARRDGWISFEGAINRFTPGAEITFRVEKEGEAARIEIARLREFRTGKDRYVVIPAGLVRSPLKTSANLVSWPAKVLHEGRVSLYSVNLVVTRKEEGEDRTAEAVVYVAGLDEGHYLLVPMEPGNFRSWAALVRSGWTPPKEAAVDREYTTEDEVLAFVRDWDAELKKKRAAESAPAPGRPAGE